jgi:hypothetical protein
MEGESKGMSDRSTARLFDEIFKMLAELPSEAALPDGMPQERAKRFWLMTWDYDFSLHNLDCEDALIFLGLVKRGPDGIVFRDTDGVSWIED